MLRPLYSRRKNPSYPPNMSQDLPQSRCCIKSKVKCTLVQALRLCTGRTPHRGSRGIALLFLDHGTRRGGGQHHTPAALYPRERPGTHCTGVWLGPRAGLDRCGKCRPHRDSIPGPSSQSPVTIPTTLPGSHGVV